MQSCSLYAVVSWPFTSDCRPKPFRHHFQTRKMSRIFHYFGMTILMRLKKTLYFSHHHPLLVIAALLALTSPSLFSFFLFFLFQFLVLVHILLFVFLLTLSAFFVKFLLILRYFYSKRKR